MIAVTELLGKDIEVGFNKQSFDPNPASTAYVRFSVRNDIIELEITIIPDRRE